MLDTWFTRPGSATRAALDALTRWFERRAYQPDTLTYLALLSGMAAGLLFSRSYQWAGVLAVVTSAVLDAVDGRLARLRDRVTAWGGVLDLTFDRVVEASVLLGVAIPRPSLHLPCLVLVATWYVNLCVFLAVGAASERQSEKVIDYPPGLLERGEALLFLLLILSMPTLAPSLVYLYAALEIFTAVQRFRHGREALSK